MNGLFGLEKRSLSFLDRGFKEEVLIYFFLSLFKLQGISPQMNKCITCGSKEVEYFDIEGGGTKCKNCASKTSLFFTPLKETIEALKKGQFEIWENLKEKEKNKILKITFKYGIYHFGDWLNRITEILPFEITP